MERRRVYRDLALALFALLCMVLSIEAIKGLKYERVLGLLMMLIYIAGLVYITMLRDGRANLGGFNFKLPIHYIKALITRKYSSVTNRSVLNMLLFIPFGCLLPYNAVLWRGKSRDGKPQFKTVVLVGFLVSLIIESCQAIFRVGVFEIDDLVKNTMGAGLGYLFYMILSKGAFLDDK